jgi:transposase
MRDTQLYQQILGLTDPWVVERVELKVAESRVDIWLKHTEGATWCCPQCGKVVGLYDHTEDRVWRHLDTCQLQTFVHARVPRTACLEHGIRKVTLPWAETGGRFTLLMERMIIDVLKQTLTISGACQILRLSWDEAFGVQRRAVLRGQARKQAVPIRYVGVDEKAFRKGHSYLTVVCDLEEGTVQHVAEDRKAESLASYYAGLTDKQQQAIAAVAMDMWEPYMQATTAGLPEGQQKIVFDRFHIMQIMNRAVDKVRLLEHRWLSSQGSDLLKGTKHWWLWTDENLPERYREDFEAVKSQHLQTGRAWAIKETLRRLWGYTSRTWAGKFFARWFGWAKRSKLAPVKKAADTFKSHLDGILTYCDHPITNGVAEGLNSLIMTIKRKACGFRNIENFKTAIYFFCGGLQLYPASDPL